MAAVKVIFVNSDGNFQEVASGATPAAGSSGANQVSIDSSNGLVIKASMIDDTQIAAAAAVDGSKLVAGSGFSETSYASTEAFSAVTATDTVKAALQNVSGFLSSLNDTTTDHSGAAKIGVEAIPGVAGSDVQTVLESLAQGGDLTQITNTVNGETYTKGHPVYMSASNTVKPYVDLSSSTRIVGLLAANVTSPDTAVPAFLLNEGSLVVAGSGLTAGSPVYWSGSAATMVMPATSGDHVWRLGTAINATTIIVKIEFVKKQA